MLEPVYDIKNCGPRHRYAANGKLVHNCGGQRINFQNLPRGSTLKEALIAPEGYLIVGADLSNIELRVGMWVAGEMAALKLLGDGGDLYKDFASKVFNVPYDEVNKEQRFIGKTSCIAEGQLVLTRRGLIPIENILVGDTVWDGVEWVHHDGVVCLGERDVITYQGLTATPDHIVFMGDSSTCKFKDASDKKAHIAITGNGRQEVQFVGSSRNGCTTDEKIRGGKNRGSMCMRGSEVGVSRNPSTGQISPMSLMCYGKIPQEPGALRNNRQANATASKKGIQYCTEMQQPDGQGVQKLRGAGNKMSVRYSKRVSRVSEIITQRIWRLRNRSHKQQWELRSGEFEVCPTKNKYAKSEKHPSSFVARGACTSIPMEAKPLCPNEHLMPIRTSGDDRGRYSCGGVGISTQQTEKLEGYTGKVRVYDILNAGPRHRYTVSGVLVHNCLSLIFGVGAAELRSAIKGRSGLDLGEVESKRIVDHYRSTYTGVTALWKTCSKAIESIATGGNFTFGTNGLYTANSFGVKFPSGLYMQYSQLANVVDPKTGKRGYKYRLRNGYDRLYAGKLTNNLVQGTARCIMSEAMVRVNKRYPIVLTIHDALYILAPEHEAQEALDYLLLEMTKVPLWMPGLPLAAEGGFGKSLKDAG